MIVKAVKCLWALGALIALLLAAINLAVLHPLNMAVGLLLLFTIFVTNPFNKEK